MTQNQSLGTRISNSQPLNLKSQNQQFSSQSNHDHLPSTHRPSTINNQHIPVDYFPLATHHHLSIMGTHQKVKTPVNPRKPRTNKRPVSSNKRKKQIKRQKPVSAPKTGAQQRAAAAAETVMHLDTEQATSISK
jgi:hypothetical protein